MVCAQELPSGRTGYRINLNQSNDGLKALLSASTYLTTFVTYSAEETQNGFHGQNLKGWRVIVEISDIPAQNAFVRGNQSMIEEVNKNVSSSVQTLTNIPVVCGEQTSSYK